MFEEMCNFIEYLYVCICVCVHAGVHGKCISVSVFACVCNFTCLSVSIHMPCHVCGSQRTTLGICLFYHVKTGTLVVCHCIYQTSWFMSFYRFSYLYLLCYHGSSGIEDAYYCIWLYAGSGDEVLLQMSYPLNILCNPETD